MVSLDSPKWRAAVQDAAMLLAGTLPLEDAAPDLLRLLGESIGWQAGAFWRLQESYLTCVDLWQEHAGDPFPARTRSMTFAPGIGLPGQVWATGKCLQIEEPAGAGALGFPLGFGGEVLGVIELFTQAPREIDPEVLLMLEQVGRLAGLFLERCRARDILHASNTELRQRLESATREAANSQELFYKAFHSNPAAMTLSRLSDGRIVDANAAFGRASDHSREATLGRTPDELGIWMEGPARDRFYHELTTNGSVKDMEITFASNTGRLDHVILSAEILDLKGELHLLTVGLDINTRLRAEEELLLALEKEKVLNQLKSSFVALVSHEFRTPLGIIMSAADILAAYFDRLTPGQREEHLAHIHEASRRMSDLMEEVLLLGRVEAGKRECNSLPFDVADWLHRLIDEMLSATNGKCEILCHIDATLQGKACADETLLRHIFTNLLSNGAKYSPPGTPVVLSARRESSEAVFEVRDQGIGIPAEDRAQLFEAFHRGRNVGVTPGSGLGLTIVKRCVDLHNGRITIQSAEGEGTIVQVRLPLFAPAIVD